MGSTFWSNTIWFSVAAISTFTIFLIQRLLGIQMLKGHFFTDPAKDNTSTGFVYQYIVLNYLIILHKTKLHWTVKTMAFSSLFIAQYLAFKADLIYISNGLFLLITSVDILGCYCLVSLCNYLLTKRPC